MRTDKDCYDLQHDEKSTTFEDDVELDEGEFAVLAARFHKLTTGA